MAVVAEDHEATISVIDHGIGIPPEERGSMFEPFHETRLTPGSVALSVARRIVEAHGGHLDVESQKGVGSTFRVRLPAYESGRTRL